MKPLIIGVSSGEISNQEKAWIIENQPLGFILFTRNCLAEDQIQNLCQELRSFVNHEPVPILIDQEGGRVVRLKPPLFRPCPAAAFFVRGLESADSVTRTKMIRLIALNAQLIGLGLRHLGINANCAPVLDLAVEGADSIIGDRSYGKNPTDIVDCGRAMAQGLMDVGVLPMMKHIPGHGRALVDSHKALPIIDTERALLEKTDFLPFKGLAKLVPWAMTAHMVFKDIDPSLPVTLSKVMIDYIREHIGFDGIIISDDLSMHALSGSFADRADQAQKAGCDVLLHCNGQLEEMEHIASALTPLSDAKKNRLLASLEVLIRSIPSQQVHKHIEQEYDHLLDELQTTIWAPVL